MRGEGEIKQIKKRKKKEKIEFTISCVFLCYHFTVTGQSSLVALSLLS